MNETIILLKYSLGSIRLGYCSIWKKFIYTQLCTNIFFFAHILWNSGHCLSNSQSKYYLEILLHKIPKTVIHIELLVEFTAQPGRSNPWHLILTYYTGYTKNSILAGKMFFHFTTSEEDTLKTKTSFAFI